MSYIEENVCGCGPTMLQTLKIFRFLFRVRRELIYRTSFCSSFYKQGSWGPNYFLMVAQPGPGLVGSGPLKAVMHSCLPALLSRWTPAPTSICNSPSLSAPQGGAPRLAKTPLQGLTLPLSLVFPKSLHGSGFSLNCRQIQSIGVGFLWLRENPWVPMKDVFQMNSSIM